MHVRAAALAALVATTLALSACSADDPGPGATSPQQTATEPPTSSPDVSATPMSLDEAADAYLAIAGDANTYFDARRDEWANALESNDWQALIEMADGRASADREFVDALVNEAWPEEIQPVVDKVIVEASTELAWFALLSQATSEADVAAAFDEIPATGFSRAAAQELRVRLGLGNIGEDN